jgi:hypothetical protein
MILEDSGDFEADNLYGVRVSSDKYQLFLDFRGGTTWTMSAAIERCPAGMTSLPGGACVQECRTENKLFVNPNTGQCLPCTPLTCDIGQTLVPCTWESDAYCMTCPVVAGTTFSMPGTCDSSSRRPVPPCQPGRYAVAGGAYCEACPEFSATLFAGAVRLEQCKCMDGLIRRNGVCVGEGLYTFEQACPTSCPLPRWAVIVPGRPCEWQCDIGFYHDTKASFYNKCKLCLTGSTPNNNFRLSRGDDDGPISCE